MAKPPPTPVPIDPDMPGNGLAEEAAVFDVEARDGDWSMELARLSEYRRTGIALDAEPVLDAFVANVRRRLAERK